MGLRGKWTQTRHRCSTRCQSRKSSTSVWRSWYAKQSQQPRRRRAGDTPTPMPRSNHTTDSLLPASKRCWRQRAPTRQQCPKLSRQSAIVGSMPRTAQSGSKVWRSTDSGPTPSKSGATRAKNLTRWQKPAAAAGCILHCRASRKKRMGAQKSLSDAVATSCASTWRANLLTVSVCATSMSTTSSPLQRTIWERRACKNGSCTSAIFNRSQQQRICRSIANCLCDGWRQRWNPGHGRLALQWMIFLIPIVASPPRSCCARCLTTRLCAQEIRFDVRLLQRVPVRLCYRRVHGRAPLTPLRLLLCVRSTRVRQLPLRALASNVQFFLPPLMVVYSVRYLAHEHLAAPPPPRSRCAKGHWTYDRIRRESCALNGYPFDLSLTFLSARSSFTRRRRAAPTSPTS